jgi:hypothetical protein
MASDINIPSDHIFHLGQLVFKGCTGATEALLVSHSLVHHSTTNQTVDSNCMAGETGLYD